MLLPILVYAASLSGKPQSPPLSRSILVFSKTMGFRHDSIPVGRNAITELGIKRGWTVTCTEDANIFQPSKLRTFDTIVFLSTTGKFLDKNQEKALVDFIHHGGGFAGIHAAADAEYDWPWYGKLVGAFFQHHPAQQEVVVKIEDTNNPITQGLPNPWKRRDEWYDYKTDPRDSVHVLASLDQSSYTGSTMGADHPIMWCHEFEGGRAWYTGMGHTQESYQDPLFLNMIAAGIEWSCGNSKRK